MIQLRNVLQKWNDENQVYIKAKKLNKKREKILEDALRLIVKTKVETTSEFKHIAALALREYEMTFEQSDEDNIN